MEDQFAPSGAILELLQFEFHHRFAPRLPFEKR
jgi:hypothetical protein